MTLQRLMYRLDDVEVVVVKVEYLGDAGSVVEEMSRGGVAFQLVPVEMTPSPRHLAIAAYKAYRAFKSRHAISKNMSIEILLYLLGSRQISDALSALRSVKSPKVYYIVACGPGASRTVENVISRYGMRLCPLDITPTLECVVCGAIGGDELRSYLGTPEEKVEKAAITRSALLVTIL